MVWKRACLKVVILTGFQFSFKGGTAFSRFVQEFPSHFKHICICMPICFFFPGGYTHTMHPFPRPAGKRWALDAWLRVIFFRVSWRDVMWRRCILLTLALVLGVLSVLLVPHGARAKARLHAAVMQGFNVEVPKVTEVGSEAAGGRVEGSEPWGCSHIALIQSLYNPIKYRLYMVVYISGYSPKHTQLFRKIGETSIDSNSIKFLGFRFQLLLVWVPWNHWWP